MTNYGIPYMGGKNLIAAKIIDFLPAGYCLVDLFGGGGGISECALVSNKWNKIIYNELNPLVYDGFSKYMNGYYADFVPRWISREDFEKEKNTDPYVAICFSFGNNLKTYAYNRQREPYKKALQNIVVYGDFTDFEKLFPQKVREAKEYMDGVEGYNRRRKALTKFCKKLVKEQTNLERLLDDGRDNQNLQRFERLQKGGNRLYNRFGRLENLECFARLDKNIKNNDKLTFLNLDYRAVDIPENAVIYCDPPYRNTAKYVYEFDYDAFYDWAERQQNIYISEYDMPEDRFVCVWETYKPCKFSSTTNNLTQEKIFVPKNNLEKIKSLI